VREAKDGFFHTGEGFQLYPMCNEVRLDLKINGEWLKLRF
jgi:hypothetical protein